MGSLGIAPPEKTGDGVLFPALVVAVGGTELLTEKQDAMPAARLLLQHLK